VPTWTLAKERMAAGTSRTVPDRRAKRRGEDEGARRVGPRVADLALQSRGWLTGERLHRSSSAESGTPFGTRFARLSDRSHQDSTHQIRRVQASSSERRASAVQGTHCHVVRIDADGRIEQAGTVADKQEMLGRRRAAAPRGPPLRWRGVASLGAAASSSTTPLRGGFDRFGEIRARCVLRRARESGVADSDIGVIAADDRGAPAV
jgi:hypothetical protein